MLACKAARRGGTVIKVELPETAMPCLVCGSVSDGQRKSQANFVCRDCGHEENADVNAALIIQIRALPGHAMAPREASRVAGSGSRGAQTAVARPSGPAAKRTSEGRDCGGRNGESVQHREFP